ncbi:PA14 domain-containing protein [Longitalea luteola]|uniref:PA14 domain-containing protein n=1 Tax=Longitalea luteola TaxID=2812563 RepID=UPI001A96AC60|nr:PA14 domain-containing protein [Longitalea luteola]
MQSFQSVNGNNLVDPFSGDFSYNIPLLDVGGYPVNLHYQSGVTMDQEASWVGLGWNINPGVISRNMRGLPDDFRGGVPNADEVTKTVSVKPNRTIGGNFGAGVNLEIFGAPIPIGVDRSYGIFHNTYKGWGIEKETHVSISVGTGSQGELTGGLSITSNSQTGTDISPSMGFTMGSKEAQLQGGITIGTNYNSRTGIQNLQITGEIKRADDGSRKQKFDPGIGRFRSNISFSKPSYTPTIRIPYTSQGFSYRAKVGPQGQGFFPGSLFVQGYISEQKVEEKTRTMPAYGYMYYEKAGNDQNVLLDYNREKDVSWSESSPHIAIPVYTYDTWSISGEGTGGMFRPFRSDIGFVFDHKMTTKSGNDNIGTNVGFGSILKAGVDYNLVNNVTKTNAWTGDNRLVDVIRFRDVDTTYENVYFKNPGEKAAVDKVYQQALGGDNLMRVELASGDRNNSLVTATRNMLLFKNARVAGKQTFDLNTVRKQRDKRGQVISYLNAAEAAAAALDKQIKWYPINSFPVSGCGYQAINRNEGARKAHHLSEITVLNPDGRRYVYGIPVYNKSQVEITMATNKDNGNNSTALVKYSGRDKSVDNNQGKDGLFNKESTPAYSHSFLLSGILSSDYVDLTGDGITQDDNGDAVKFNYSQAYSLNQPYRWRAPYQLDSASYNEGLKTDKRDDKGSFTYGEREVWYLNSVESKTMIATFVLDADRKDGYGVNGEDGGQNAGQKLYKLKEINLYTKADFLKNGTNARPIKTVHFEYNYELCKKNLGSLADSGKLTLKKVWFSYSKNEKGRRNPYIFTYGANPDYSQRSVDRWGNYKDPANNPGNGTAMTNADYPYTLQTGVKTWDTTKAAANAAPWALSEIKLPSGGRLKITYESDDYAYVQNKRAMQFFTIAGFGNSQNSTPQPVLYPNKTANDDYHVVFITVTEPVNSAAEVGRKYLDGVNQLFFKLAVNMPGDRWGNGYELVPCYAEIENYGVASHINNKTIWVRVKAIKDRQSPFATAAIQFLRLNLPSKAYPWSEPGDKIDIRAAVGMMTSVFSGVVNLLKEANYENKARGDNRCRSVVLDRSFARLDNPIYRKFGGGLRVKKTELFDNWNKMTSQVQKEARYGQTYTYTDTVMIDGVPTGISSGVASYEPMIGGDENPFHVPAKVYAEKVGAMGPTDYLYAEEPFAETFFPGPSVGYSKVRVQTIHRDKKSANGFDESTFYTAKDFPTIVEYTPIDGDSKKSFKTPIKNPFFFDARNYVTLSQGFKIELNDMHGKPKSQASYGQNDLNNPINYTYNYYKLVNDNAAQAKLSGRVAIAGKDGTIDTDGEMGKEVEVMIDVREQKSETTSGNIEANMDLIWLVPPITAPIFTIIPLFNGETNRYRSVAVLKIINRYGILDSVLRIDKGSRVTMRNLVYDGETGEVLLTQTNNEFDDPVYDFNYPAHWAYTGMAPAYQNIGTVLKNIRFRKGIMLYGNNSRVPASRYFESGDELLVFGNDKRTSTIDDHCKPDYYQFDNDPKYKKIWAVDASRGTQGQKGLYFIDADGLPYSCDAQHLRIIRSGKRNMAGTSVGNITSQETPVRLVGGVPKLVFDPATRVINASAARFKDLWMVDSTLYPKDTSIIATHRVHIERTTLTAVDNYAIHDYKGGGNGDNRALGHLPNHKYFEATAYDDGEGSWDEQIRSFLRFNMDGIPQNAIITSATLRLYGTQGIPHKNQRASTNRSWIERLSAGWVRDVIDNAANEADIKYAQGFYWSSSEPLDLATRVLLPATAAGVDEVRNENVNITPMARAMLHDRYALGNPPVIRIRLDDPGGGHHLMNRLIYNTHLTPEQCTPKTTCLPAIDIEYIIPCADGSQPWYAETPPFGADDGTPGPGYYCNLWRVDTFVCRPNINDTAVNFYRFGILGNWRPDREYTYYSRREQSDALSTTNIRKDGVIKDFAPYWSFTNTLMTANSDESRWVWNSEMTRFNNKGFEIENHDPIDRFNAGQYGYNNTLPIAAAQNARSREIAFDGFEDYGYQTNNCKNCLINRHADFGSNANLVATESHTGLYSLCVEGNNAVNKYVSLGSASEDAIKPELSMKEDSIPLVSTVVHGNGPGLGNYYFTNGGGCYPYEVNNPNKPPLYTGINSNINYKIHVNEIQNTCRTEYIFYSFRGYIQPRYTGVYKFWCTADDAMSIYITKDGVTRRITQGRFMEDPSREEHEYATAYETETIELEQGELYEIVVLWDNNGGDYHAKLEWESQGLQSQWREVVPATQLYPLGSDINTVKANTVFRDTTWCVQFKPPTGSNVINKRFSPLQKQKVVVSAWVKQEGPCTTGNYDGARLNLSFNNGSGTSFFSLKPSGTIIEGWQRIEDTLTIPETATGVSVSMSATSSSPVYFDDIRVQPFHSNMKSFVYNPINLRLMAELDENNYATFYEYDDEGTMIRLKKETERGIKTLKETRSAMSKE